MASSKLAKVEQRLSARTKAAAVDRKIEKVEVWQLGGGAALGLVERMKWDIPSIPGVPDAVAYGAVAVLLGKSKGAGMSRNLRSLGMGMLTCGVRDMVSGRTKLGQGGGYMESVGASDEEVIDI